jgi:hypothetical protein
MVWAAIMWYSSDSLLIFMAKLLQVHPMIKTLFINNDSVFKGDSAFIHPEMFPSSMRNTLPPPTISKAT